MMIDHSCTAWYWYGTIPAGGMVPVHYYQQESSYYNTVPYHHIIPDAGMVWYGRSTHNDKSL